MKADTRNFGKWLANAKPGESYIYRVGMQLAETRKLQIFSPKVWDAREAFERGEVELVQKRLSIGNKSKFAWMAVKKAEAKRPQRHISKDGEYATWGKRPPQTLTA